MFNSVVLDTPGSPAILYPFLTPPRLIGVVAEASHAGKQLLSHLSPVIDKAMVEVEASNNRDVRDRWPLLWTVLRFKP